MQSLLISAILYLKFIVPDPCDLMARVWRNELEVGTVSLRHFNHFQLSETQLSALPTISDPDLASGDHLSYWISRMQCNADRLPQF